MKHIFSLLLLIFLFKIGFSQENALLWEINKKGYHTSYVFGSIHSNDKAIISFGNQALPYLKKCRAYAGEIIISTDDMFAFIPYLIEKDSSKQCKNLLSAQEMTQVQELAEENLGKEMTLLIPYMSPYLVSAIIANPNDLKSTNSGYFLDIYLQEIADSLGHQLISLETVKSQLDYIQKIDGEAQKRFLLETITNSKEIETELDNLIETYLNQDLNAIQTLLLTASKEDPLFTSGFMEDRNKLQASGIIDAMKQQKTFVAIGAAHLPSDNGVLKILVQEGFSIKAISLP